MPETQNIRNNNAHEQGIRFLSLLNLMTLLLNSEKRFLRSIGIRTCSIAGKPAYFYIIYLVWIKFRLQLSSSSCLEERS